MIFDTYTVIQLGFAFGYYVFASVFLHYFLNSWYEGEKPGRRSTLVAVLMVQALSLIGITAQTTTFIVMHGR